MILKIFLHLTLYNFFGLLLIILAGIIRFRIKGDLGKEQEKEIKEELTQEKG